MLLASVQSLAAQEKKDPTPNLPVSGNLKSVDEQKKTITIESGFGKKKETNTYPLADSVEVRFLRVNSEAIKLSDLQADERINLILDPDSKKVVRVISMRAPARPFRANIVRSTATRRTSRSKSGRRAKRKRNRIPFPIPSKYAANRGRRC